MNLATILGQRGDQLNLELSESSVVVGICCLSLYLTDFSDKIFPFFLLFEISQNCAGC